MSFLDEVVKKEEYRQWRTLILIPSEGICNPYATSYLSSVFTNIYAEGHPYPPLLRNARRVVFDVDYFERWQRRFGDGRFYKGCINADVVELVAQENVARVFAPKDGSVPLEDIFVNVQPLSGAAANTAVYAALLEPGDCIMGLDLACGGHLTHGSRFNVSGKTYTAVSYGIDEKTRLLDYDAIRRIAKQHKPKIIIGGSSAYPWDFDWQRLKEIAREVGAYLMADIAHLAGMVAAGCLNNPVGIADIVTFTTHKSFFGPRGAVIITTDRRLNNRIRNGVFPGLQGGPHVHTMTAIAAQAEWILAHREEFESTQRRIIENAAILAHAMMDEGFSLEYGGTNTHLFLVDLKRFRCKGDGVMDGEVASRMLELCGIVCNKNALPGDAGGVYTTGVRMGTPWITQRGIRPDHLRELASIVRLVLENVHTFHIMTKRNPSACRGRIAGDVLEEATRRVLKIVESLPYPPRPEEPCKNPPSNSIVLRGYDVMLTLDQVTSGRVIDMLPGQERVVSIFAPNGDFLANARAVSLGRDERGMERVRLDFDSRRTAVTVSTWLKRLSDGYVIFEEGDLYAKIHGPFVVDFAGEREVQVPSGPVVRMDKTFFIGQKALQERRGDEVPTGKKASYRFEEKGEREVRETPLAGVHEEMGGKMVEFAGWRMPLHYRRGIFQEHKAVRTSAGLFDVSHMGIIEISGVDAAIFLEYVLASSVYRLEVGTAAYSCMMYPDGTVMDDLYVYRLSEQRFFLVVNAANAERDMDWLNTVVADRVVIDPAIPSRRVPRHVRIRDMKSVPDGSLALFALQGPASPGILASLCKSSSQGDAVRSLGFNRLVRVSLAGVDVVLSGTGYTGESAAYEIFCPVDYAENLWRALVECGAIPCGLGARDSTRVEAGLPLFGHEIEGPHVVNMHECGYGFVVKTHKPFFIGRMAYIERMRSSTRRVIRFTGGGRRALREGHSIVDDEGKVVGVVTSFAFVNEQHRYFGLAVVEGKEGFAPGEVIRGVRLRPEAVAERGVEEKMIVEVEVLSRFPSAPEREEWRQVYAE